MTVSQLRVEMIERFDRVDLQMTALGSDLQEQIGELKSDFAGQIGGLKSEIGGLKSDLERQIAEARSELRLHMDILYEKLRDDLRLLGEAGPRLPDDSKPRKKRLN